MQSFPIMHISRNGPNQPGDVLFLESFPDYKHANERRSAFQKKYADCDIVIYRMSRDLTPRGEKGERRKTHLSRELPDGATKSGYLREPSGLTTINYALYAVTKGKAPPANKPGQDPWADEVIAISKHLGQQGDPSTGGTHFNPDDTEPAPEG
jgi:hypothetical protein